MSARITKLSVLTSLSTDKKCRRIIESRTWVQRMRLSPTFATRTGAQKPESMDSDDATQADASTSDRSSRRVVLEICIGGARAYIYIQMICEKKM